MEKFPGQIPNKTESAPERILNSQEVLDAISQHAEGFSLRRELSDEKGVYLLEVVMEGEKEGETVEYVYWRKGDHGKNSFNETSISVAYYEDDMPVHSDKVAVLDEETGEWRRL